MYVFRETPSKSRPIAVEDLFAAQAVADRLQLVEQRLDDQAFAGLGGDQIDDLHRVVLLAVAVDAAHALFKAGRVPRARRS